MSDDRDSFLRMVGEDIAKKMEPELKLMAADIVSDFWQREASRLTAERDSALAQNSELVAMVEAIKDDWMAAGSWPDTVEVKQAIANAINASPTQHLRDRDAEVGRTGFVAGFELCQSIMPPPWRALVVVNYQGAADQYAEKVRMGEV